MSRLTSELSSHKILLDELHSLREADRNTLRQKVREVNLLRQEVEKIAGEVEVLASWKKVSEREGDVHTLNPMVSLVAMVWLLRSSILIIVVCASVSV
jgi:hypothetical protein